MAWVRTSGGVGWPTTLSERAHSWGRSGARQEGERGIRGAVRPPRPAAPHRRPALPGPAAPLSARQRGRPGPMGVRAPPPVAVVVVAASARRAGTAWVAAPAVVPRMTAVTVLALMSAPVLALMR